jgi:hypothetical protein
VWWIVADWSTAIDTGLADLAVAPQMADENVDGFHFGSVDGVQTAEVRHVAL